ncbi:uncharacterized protein TNCV_3907111 [Trichonephila clavipes]|nr:uncharacterized protein TNCV_3907111 [Trichonephila clavipes]
MSKNGLKQKAQEITVLMAFLTSSQKKWANVENRVEFLSKEMPDIKIDDSCRLEEERRLNAFLNTNKLGQLENQDVEKLIIYERNYLNHFKNEHIPCEIVFILLEFTLYCRGTNAAVERVFFSVGNDFYEATSEKSKSNVNILDTVLGYFLPDFPIC